MIKLSFCQSNWRHSFREIYVLKRVNKLCFYQNHKKWANLVYFIYFLIFSRAFKIWENFKAIFPYNLALLLAFSQVWKAFSNKKQKCVFYFGSEEVIINLSLTRGELEQHRKYFFRAFPIELLIYNFRLKKFRW